MNRREALQSGLGLLAAAGIKGNASTIDADAVAVVLTVPGWMSPQIRENLREQWKQLQIGGGDIPIVIIGDGMTMQQIKSEHDHGNIRKTA